MQGWDYCCTVTITIQLTHSINNTIYYASAYIICHTDITSDSGCIPINHTICRCHSRTNTTRTPLQNICSIPSSHLYTTPWCFGLTQSISILVLPITKCISYQCVVDCRY